MAYCCHILCCRWARTARSSPQAAEEAVDSGRQNGVLTDSHLRFLRLDTDSGSTIVFADTSNETQTLTGLFRTCLLLCSAAFIAF